ncbi:MAG: histone [Candidatus Aenigmatarchaeota archaeon]
MAKLHLATFEKFLKDSKSGIGVSSDASSEMVEVMTELAEEISKESAELATHANRKTILRDDIKMAARRFRKH